MREHFSNIYAKGSGFILPGPLQGYGDTFAPPGASVLRYIYPCFLHTILSTTPV